MKLENIESNKILASCRYANGSKGEDLFELYHSYDFEQFDKWNIVADFGDIRSCQNVLEI